MIGQTISHYQILEKIGAGGMGVVYKAEDTKLKRTIALKFLPPGFDADSEALDRFVHEAQVASALDHPNICTIYEIGETDQGRSFIAMACYDGQTLKDGIKDQKLKIEDAIYITIQVAKGLSRAHEKGIFHRDIKPANIMVTDRGEVKILDFGLAKLIGQTRTKTGSTFGTVSYMSPEQVRGTDIDHRTDIWSLGVVLYEMLTGQLPFDGEYEQAVMFSIINDEPAPIREKGSIPTELRTILNKAMTKDPVERYQTIEEVLHDFEPLSGEAKLIREESLSQFLTRAFRKKSVRYTTLIAGATLFLAIAFLLLRPLLFKDQLRAGPSTVAVIAFDNNTGDASYDNLKMAIPSLLITSISQSDRFQVISLPKLHELRKQMDKDNFNEIDADLGFEICQRYGIPLIVVGSFVKAGDIFATDVKVMDATEKTILASASSRGEGISSLLEKQIDDMSMQIISQFGYSSKEFVQDYKPVKIATTQSIDAYNFYVKANQHGVEGEERKKLLELAIETDSTFASAYIDLADFYRNDTLKMAEIIKKARTYAKNVPEKESLLIESKYYRYFAHNSSQAIELLENAIQKYPTDGRLHYQLALYYHGRGRMKDAFREYKKTAELEPYLAMNWNQLAYEYSRNHQYDQALVCLEKYAELAPGHPNAYDSMGDIYLQMGKLDKAVERYQKSLALGWETEKAHLAYAYALKEDYGESIRLWQSCDDCWNSRPDFKYFVAAFYYFFQGRRQDMDEELQKLDALQDSTLYWRAPEYWYIAHLFNSWIFFEDGSYAEGLRHLNQAMIFLSKAYDRFQGEKLFDAHRWYYAGLVKVNQNQLDSARYYLKQIDTASALRLEVANQIIEYERERLLLEILLAEGKTDEALTRVDSLQIFGMVDKGYPNLIFYNLPFRDDIIPRVYLANDDVDGAIRTYEELTNIYPAGNDDRRFIPPWFHYRLAKLYEQDNQPHRAIERYSHFLQVWKNADPDIRELKDAQKRLAILKGNR